MTPQQVNVFMEERKWDYRGNLEYPTITLPALKFFHSIRVCCCLIGRNTHYRVSFHDFEPCWCSHVGPWYVSHL